MARARPGETDPTNTNDLRENIRDPRPQQTMPVIGYLNSGSPAPEANRLEAFRKGLREVGFVEGGNVSIEYRWAEGRYDRYCRI